MRRFVAVLVACLLVAPVAAAFAKVAEPAGGKEVDPRTATLSEAIADWVNLLELDATNAHDTAAQRWARDAETGESLRKLWAALQGGHAEYDYRTWITGGDGRPAPAADKVGDADTFTVGGCKFGHLNVRWKKADAGWRIAGVFECR